MDKLGSTGKAIVIAAAREILARPGTVENQWVRRLAAMRWVQLDARAFFMEKEEKCPPALLEAALLAWCRSDPASALRWLAYRGEKVSCWGTAMADICRSSPLLVKDYIQEAERGDFPCIDAKMDPVVMHEGPEELLAALVLQIGLHADPAWAMQHRERLGSLTEGPAAHVLNHWAGLDAAAAVAWSTGLVEQKDRLHAVGMCIQAIGTSDPDQALALHKRYPEAAQQVYLDSDDIRVLDSVAVSLAKRDGVRALVEISNWGDEESFIASLRAVENLTIPPEGPEAMLAELGDIRKSDEGRWDLIRRHLYEAWHPADPRVALQSTLAWNVDNDTVHVQKVMLERCSDQSWSAAAGWVENLPAGNQRDYLGRELAAQGLSKDPQQTLNWMAAQSISLTKSDLSDAHLPSGALRALAATQVGVEPAIHCDLVDLSGHMARALPPAEVITWINALPDEAVQLEAMEGLIKEWGARDATMAQEWIYRLPESPMRSAALAAMPQFTPPVSQLPKPKTKGRP
jgi:hypothetical protein